jgi:hypothetical protein
MRSCQIFVLPKATPAGTLDIPDQAWVPLMNLVREHFRVSLKVYDDYPLGAEAPVEVGPNRNLIIELVGDSQEVVGLAFRAIHGHIDDLIERYTKTNTDEVAAEQQ